MEENEMTETVLPIESKKYEVSIEYCVPCNYSPHAFRVTEELLGKYQHIIDKLVLIMGSNGVFEVKVNSKLIFSKKALTRHPNPGEILQLFKERVGLQVST